MLRTIAALVVGHLVFSFSSQASVIMHADISPDFSFDIAFNEDWPQFPDGGLELHGSLENIDLLYLDLSIIPLEDTASIENFPLIYQAIAYDPAFILSLLPNSSEGSVSVPEARSWVQLSLVAVASLAIGVWRRRHSAVLVS